MKKFLALLLLSLQAQASVVLPYTFSPNTSIQSAHVNADFGALRDEINTHEAASNPHQTALSDILGLNNSCGAYSINFNGHQAIDMAVENLSSDPAPATKGRIFFNTIDGLLKFDDGSSIISIAGSGVNSLSSVLNAGNSAGSHDIDVNERQLLRARVENLSSDPSAGNAGRVYYNTSSSALKLDTGSAITTIGGSQGLSSVLGVSNSAGSTNVDFNLNQALNLVLDKKSSDPGTGTTARIYYNTTSNIPKFYNGSSWLQVGNTNTLAQTLAIGASVGSNDIDFNSHQAKNMVLYNNSGSPGTGTGGFVWYDTGTSLINYETSSANHALLAADTSQTVTNKSISGSSNTLTNIADSSLSANVGLLNSNQSITGVKTFSTNPVLGAIKSTSGATMTVPSGFASDTFALLNATQTMGGKTLLSPAFVGNTDFFEGQASHFRVENLVSDPSPGNAGRIYYKTTTGELIYDDGSHLRVLSASGNSLGVGTIDSEAVPSSDGATLFSNSLILQSASTSVPGLVNTGAQSFAGNKTFTGAVSASNLSGTNTGDVTLTAVGAVPSANGASLSGQALTLQPADTTHPGVVTAADWNTFNNKQATVSVGALDAQAANASGLAFVGNVFSQQSADATHPGLMNTGTQTIAGAKTFSGGVTATLTGTATNATNGATVAVSSNASFFPLFVASSTNGNQAFNLGTGLSFNPSTNALTTTTFVGALTGHASLDLALTGGTMSGAIAMGTSKITGMGDPSAAQDAATKAYVDSQLLQLNPADSVYAASTANVGGTYTNAVSGVCIGDTFTTTATTAFALDGTSPSVGARVLFKDQTSSWQDGVWTLTTQAVGGVTGAILTRALDFDSSADINSGQIIPIVNGTVNAGASYFQTATNSTCSSDAQTWTQFQKAASAYLLKASNLSDVAAKSTSFDNLSPMSASGDIIYGGTSGTGTRLPKGSNGQILTLTAGLPSWAAAPAASALTPLTKTANYTITSVDTFIIADTSSGSFTLTFPAASGTSGLIFHIKKIGGNQLTLARTGSDLIDGDTSAVVTSPYTGLNYISDGGTNYYGF